MVVLSSTEDDAKSIAVLREMHTAMAERLNEHYAEIKRLEHVVEEQHTLIEAMRWRKSCQDCQSYSVCVIAREFVELIIKSSGITGTPIVYTSKILYGFASDCYNFSPSQTKKSFWWHLEL